MIEGWLRKEYIQKWYDDPKDWLEEIINIDGEYHWIKHYLVEF